MVSDSVAFRKETGARVLILVVMEYGLRHKKLESIGRGRVLILVVMEYGLRQVMGKTAVEGIAS